MGAGVTWVEPWEPVTGTGVREAYTPGPPTTWRVIGTTSPFATVDALAAKLPSCRQTKRRARSVARRMVRAGFAEIRVDMMLDGGKLDPEEVIVTGTLHPNVRCHVHVGFGRIWTAWVGGHDVVAVKHGNGDHEVQAAIVQARMKLRAW